ncbi:MAG TPA: hypothetical protein VN578_18800, partial [Candidatus Binatia bacterium]|nr:hypothetical protein [Candidatus Binatia bacterium]
MPRFLYIFGYQTPEQMNSSASSEAPEEASMAVFIEAQSADEALGWGRELSEEYGRRLFPGRALSWKSLNFAHWIEANPQQEYPADLLASLPVVPCGSYPDFDRL